MGGKPWPSPFFIAALFLRAFGVNNNNNSMHEFKKGEYAAP
jgi:hypothetical protein